jgi:hypothetical protein
MARVVFATWQGGGNQILALGIACALSERGHAVAFIGQESQRRRIEAAGFAFTAYASRPAWETTPAAPPSPAAAQGLIAREDGAACGAAELEACWRQHASTVADIRRTRS